MTKKTSSNIDASMHPRLLQHTPTTEEQRDEAVAVLESYMPHMEDFSRLQAGLVTFCPAT